MGAVGTALMALGAVGYGFAAHCDLLLIVCAGVGIWALCGGLGVLAALLAQFGMNRKQLALPES